MSIDYAVAKRMALTHLEQLSKASDGVTYALLESHIREESDGWYFPYQSEKYLLTRHFGDSLVGNWPIFVSRTGNFAGPRRPGMIRSL